jgi:hypothetical protein
VLTARRTCALLATASLLAGATAVAAQADGTAGGVTGARICTLLQLKLGAKFAAAFASESDCEAQIAPVALTALGTCGVSGPAVSFVQRTCVRTNVLSALRSMFVGTGAGNVAKAAGRLATAVCTRVQANHPDAFARRFSSSADCETTITGLASTAIAGCVGVAKPGTDDFRACVKAALQAAAHRPAAPASA